MMAPIHNQQTSYSTHHSASSTASPLSCACRGVLSDSWEWFLPITRRGHFFQDSFFENARSHFDSAIRDVLGRWGETDMLTDSWHDTTNNFSRYRQLRSRNLGEENQAVTVSSEGDSHKIVLDVHDFMEGEVKVKVIGEKEVLVEGLTEKRKNGDSINASAQQKFSRRFLLPEWTDVENITSVMSSDGILTINTPRKTSANSQGSVRVLETKGASTNSTAQSTSTTTQSAQMTNEASAKSTKATEVHDRDRYCENCYKKLHSEKKTSEESCQQQSGVKIPIKINTSLVRNDVTSQSQEAQNTFASKSFSENKNTSSSLTSQTESSQVKKEEARRSNQSEARCENNDRVKTMSERNDASTDKSDVSGRDIPISVNFTPLPITRRGLFFNDSVFESARNDFQTAVQEILSKWGERSSLMDDLTCYRNLRTRDLREENQAVKVSEDETNHKFILDVHDFMNGGEVNIKAINDRELVVEGQIERQEGGSKSVKRFLKRFVLPNDIKLGSVSSVVSSDGILTITAPKKPPTIEIRDVTSPIRTDKVQEVASENKQQSVRGKQETTATQSSAATSRSLHESHESVSSSNTHQTSSSNGVTLPKEHIIPVHVEGRSNKVKIDHTAQMTNSTNSTSSESERSREKIIKTNLESSVNEKNANTSVEGNRQQEIKITQNSNVNKSSEVDSRVSSANQKSHNAESLTATSTGRMLPINRKGAFFNDSFFEDSRQRFQTAVRDVLLKSNESSNFDDITTYRGLRQRNLTFENQACNVHEDEHCHKVVIDAKDFTDGDITVSVVGERELVIEGRAENKKDASSSSLTFSRRFLLPESVEISNITSAISSDGILTVESPKMGASSLSGVKKTSSEAHSRNESHHDSGHSWEEKAVKESSEQAEGYSSRTYSTSYRAHQEHTSTNAL